MLVKRKTHGLAVKKFINFVSRPNVTVWKEMEKAEFETTGQPLVDGVYELLNLRWSSKWLSRTFDTAGEFFGDNIKRA